MIGGVVRGLGKMVGRGGKRVSRHGIYPFLDAQLEQIERGSRVLSIGAGGEIGDRMVAGGARCGLDLVQLDIDPERGAGIVADICEWRSETPFDAIICSEVLEHLWAPHQAVANMWASLRAGGRLILTAPFVFPIHSAPHDYFRYTRYGLEVLLRDFKDVTIEERTSWAESFGVLAVRMLRGRERRALAIAVVPAVVASYPLLRMMGRLIRADEMTTGYNVVAFR
jgi:SAM-dependent methyltransferase